MYTKIMMATRDEKKGGSDGISMNDGSPTKRPLDHENGNSNTPPIETSNGVGCPFGNQRPVAGYAGPFVLLFSSV